MTYDESEGNGTYHIVCTKQDIGQVPKDALKVRGKSSTYIMDLSGGSSYLEPGKVGAIDLALWMDNNSIEEAISSLSKLGRDPIDWKQIGIIALVGIVGIYLAYVFMA